MLKIEVVQDTITLFLKEFQTEILPEVIPDTIGHILLADIQDHFQKQESPEGEPWEPLSPITIEKRRKQSDVPLQDTGQMLGSIHVVSGMPQYQTAVAMSKYDHHFGVNVPELQHEGGTGYILEPDGTVTTIEVPARPFMGASESALREIEAIPGEMFP